MMPNRKQTQPLLQSAGLALVTPEGRVLIDSLNLCLDTDKVAIIGRNGCGKSTLVETLAGLRPPDRGSIRRAASTAIVTQQVAGDVPALARALEETLVRSRSAPAIARELVALGLPELANLQKRSALSRGELRKLALLIAKHSGAELLFLDEPTEDLDAQGVTWLLDWLCSWPRGLVLVSHHARLLREFRHFFVVAESGCRYLMGSYTELQKSLEREALSAQERYLRNLTMLSRREEHSARVASRRRRKKNGGRVREIDRAPSRALLNTKRSYAQESQGKRTKMQEARISASRAWARASRRALSVKLPLSSVVPHLPADDGHDNVRLRAVELRRGQRALLGPLDLQLRRQTIAVTGPNGSGKTSLLQLMLGEIEATSGQAQRRSTRIGSIAQGGSDWMLPNSLLSHLSTHAEASSLAALAARIVAHKFPLALAERPLASLSPGERVRAALLCLFEQSPAVEVLILDEPTYSLDIVGQTALLSVLRAWSGGLVIASHDREFLRGMEFNREIVLHGPR